MSHTQLSDKDCQHLIAIICKAQSILHDIDEIRGSAVFKHEMKKQCNQINNNLEKLLTPYYKLLGYDSLESFCGAFDELDSFASTIKFTHKNELQDNP